MMLRSLIPQAWPVTVKVPLLVVALMVAVSTIMSDQILTRLSENQETNLRALTGAYLDGVSTAVMPYVLREDIWEVFDNLSRAQDRYTGLDSIYVIVARPDGSVLAASDPLRFPTQSLVPQALRQRVAGSNSLVLDEPAGRAWTHRLLQYQERPIGSLYTEIDIGGLLNERHNVLLTLVLTNGALTLAFTAFGYFMVRRMVRPIDILAEHVERVRDGQIEPIPVSQLGDSRSEFGRLFRRFNAMAVALNEKDALATRLAEEEKLASLGRLASGMAHEINNPLGGLLTTVDTLRRHGDSASVRQSSLNLLERGLMGIRDVVRSALVTYKGGAAPDQLGPEELDDLRYLIKHEIVRRRLKLLWRNELTTAVPIDGDAARQATLNLLLNACAASPVGSTVVFTACLENKILSLSIEDEGPGLPENVVALLADVKAGGAMVPLQEGGGLGIWMVARLVDRMNGAIDVDQARTCGTRITMRIPVAVEVKLDDVA